MNDEKTFLNQSTTIPYTPVATAAEPPLYGNNNSKPTVVETVPVIMETQQPLLVSTPMAPVVLQPVEPKTDPVQCICPHCQASVETKVKFKAGNMACIVSVIGCLVIGLIGALIPFCGSCMKDAEHYCPNCGNLIAKYKRTF